MKDIEVLLIQAWKLAMQQGYTDLAQGIVSLPGLLVPKPPETTKAYRFDQFRVPSGKYRGRLLNQLNDSELQNVWSGFNGCGNVKVANILKAEIDSRR